MHLKLCYIISMKLAGFLHGWTYPPRLKFNHGHVALFLVTIFNIWSSSLINGESGKEMIVGDGWQFYGWFISLLFRPNANAFFYWEIISAPKHTFIHSNWTLTLSLIQAYFMFLTNILSLRENHLNKVEGGQPCNNLKYVVVLRTRGQMSFERLLSLSSRKWLRHPYGAKL